MRPQEPPTLRPATGFCPDALRCTVWLRSIVDPGPDDSRAIATLSMATLLAGPQVAQTRAAHTPNGDTLCRETVVLHDPPTSRQDRTCRMPTTQAAGAPSSLNSLNSNASTSASQLASMMFSLTPTVLHTSCSSALSITTRTRAAVPSAELMTRTL